MCQLRANIVKTVTNANYPKTVIVITENELDDAGIKALKEAVRSGPAFGTPI